MRWVNGGNDRPICWLNGPPGFGKSAVSQTVAEICATEKTLAASYFFSRRPEDPNFIHTLAYQLSVSVPATKKYIQDALHEDQTILEHSLSSQFEQLMIEPILAARNANLAPPTHWVIVVDALDACDNKELMEEFIEAITTACRAVGPFPFRVFLTSTVEQHLRRKLETPSARPLIYPLDLQHFNANDDIRTFFRSQFSTIHDLNSKRMRHIPSPWPSTSDVDALVEKAGGSFRHASELISLIHDETDEPGRQLATVLGRKPDHRPQQSPSRLSRFIKWPVTRSASQQTSTSESSHDVSPPSTSSIPLSLSQPTAGGSEDVPGRAQTQRPRVLTTDIPPPPPELHESPVEGGPFETLALEGLIDNLILPCASISLRFCHLS
jgi:hypothetical protein